MPHYCRFMIGHLSCAYGAMASWHVCGWLTVVSDGSNRKGPPLMDSSRSDDSTFSYSPPPPMLLRAAYGNGHAAAGWGGAKYDAREHTEARRRHAAKRKKKRKGQQRRRREDTMVWRQQTNTETALTHSQSHTHVQYTLGHSQRASDAHAVKIQQPFLATVAHCIACAPFPRPWLKGAGRSEGSLSGLHVNYMLQPTGCTASPVTHARSAVENCRFQPLRWKPDVHTPHCSEPRWKEWVPRILLGPTRTFFFVPVFGWDESCCGHDDDMGFCA